MFLFPKIWSLIIEGARSVLTQVLPNKKFDEQLLPCKVQHQHLVQVHLVAADHSCLAWQIWGSEKNTHTLLSPWKVVELFVWDRFTSFLLGGWLTYGAILGIPWNSCELGRRWSFEFGQTNVLNLEWPRKQRNCARVAGFHCRGADSTRSGWRRTVKTSAWPSKHPAQKLSAKTAFAQTEPDSTKMPPL